MTRPWVTPSPMCRCRGTRHLKRNLLGKVRHGDKMSLADDLRDVFRTGDRSYTCDDVWGR